MPKSDQGIWRVIETVFFSQESHTFLVVIPHSFIEEEDYPIYMESGRFPFETKGERGNSLLAITCSPFFDGTISRNLCPKKCLTTSKMVVCEGGWGL